MQQDQQQTDIYTALYKIVRPILRHYETDLIKHDRQALESENYTGPFIYGYRSTGTSIVKLLPTMAEYENAGLKVGEKYLFGTIQDERHKLEILRGFKTWITHPGTNEYFLYFDGKKLRSKTREQITEIYDDHINRVISKAKPHINLSESIPAQLYAGCGCAW